MEHSHFRPRISRETRLLLITAFIAVAALWTLARLRFPDRPASSNPVPALLTQLADTPQFDGLASEISQLESRLGPMLLTLDVPRDPFLDGKHGAVERVPALRVQDDLAVALLPADVTSKTWEGQSVIARDPASGLGVVRVAAVPVQAPSPWSPRRPQQARYLVATDVSQRGVSMRPVFVGTLDPVETPLWSAPIWAAPPTSDLSPGSFLFTSTAELVGVVVEFGGERTIVPGETVLMEVDRLLNERGQPAGEIGVLIQPMTPPLAIATGATSGVIVTWIDRTGVGNGTLAVGDVIETVDGQAVATPQHWQARLGRLSAGETLTLGVRRRGELREVRLVAPVRSTTHISRSLGLTMQSQPAIGSEILDVERGSAADRSGLQPGDVITLIGAIPAPTPAQVRSAFSSASEGRPVLVAVTRRDAHRVLALDR